MDRKSTLARIFFRLLPVPMSLILGALYASMGLDFVEGQQQIIPAKPAAPTARVSPSPRSIFITPTTMALEFGEAREVTVIDDEGRRINDAAVKSENPFAVKVATTNDVTTLIPILPFQTTITATWRNLTARARVEVYWGHVPRGSLLWSVHSMPGFTTGLVFSAQPHEGAPDIYIVETGGPRGWLIRGLGISGNQLWLTHLDPTTQVTPLERLPNPGGQPRESPDTAPIRTRGKSLLLITEGASRKMLLGARGDSFGGIYLGFQDQNKHTTLVRFDGATGGESWRYASPGYLYPYQTANREGTLAVVENLDPPSSKAVLLGIDERTGSIRFRVPLPPSVRGARNLKCKSGVSQIVASPPQASAPITAEDRAIYLEVEVTKSITDDLPCKEGGSLDFEDSMRLLRVTADGAASWRTLKRFQYHGRRNAPEAKSLPRTQVGEVIPDGFDGLLAGWTLAVDGPRNNPEAHVTRVSGDSLTEYTLPLTGWGGSDWVPPARTLALGEKSLKVAYGASLNKVVAFDLETGKVKWSWQSSTCAPQMEAAASGGGLVLYMCGEIMRLDARGQATYDDWTGGPPQGTTPRRHLFSETSGEDFTHITMLTYSLGNQWLAINSPNPLGGDSAAVAISGDPILWPWSIWP
jgi:hypothetical protein